ncbi:outer membrane protein transport protein [uncultured Endozoicomonas sp.]|uniref:OmpP1/FadL family transporter n=1 Tax=uncultured Endozoicomonas sp. TaxID=432652 RepID=UPI00261617BE|nr:outer membrane protein transport protein [uncultured Endozoicomonas sp.]
MASQVSFVQAAGYGINEQSASYLGTGFAGRASNAIDASISATNPAGISFLEGGRQISVGADVILEGGSFDGEYTRPRQIGSGNITTDAGTDDFQKTSFVPFGYFVVPIDEKWSFGLAGYAPYGIELDYENGWGGEYFADKTSVKVMNLQGTLSYKFNDDLAIGFGLIGSHVAGELTQKSWVASDDLGIPSGVIAGDGTIKGDDNTLGWNLGAIWNVNDSTTLGLAYHSKLDFTLEGDFDVEDIPVVGSKSDDASLKITMPEKIMFSATHKVDEQWTVMADATWTRWSRFQEFHVTSPNPDLDSYVPMNWKNTWALSLGTSYQLDEKWLLRAGYMFDESPVSNDTRTVRSPDANRNWFTLGANLKLAENMNMDFAYAYVKLNSASIDEAKYKGPGELDSDYGSISGDYDSSSHIFGVQLNYLF